jgi:hypothetical protein
MSSLNKQLFVVVFFLIELGCVITRNILIIFELISLLISFYSFLFQSLLDEPNPNSPANNESANLYQSNKKEYRKRVREIVELSWMNHILS